MTPNRIGLLREQAKLSREELAQKLGVTARTVYRYEAGKTVPDGQKLALSTLFSVTVTFLMGWSENGENGNGDNGEREAA
jgi:transcriptional regulator with XRE-family HTH domain